MPMEFSENDRECVKYVIENHRTYDDSVRAVNGSAAALRAGAHSDDTDGAAVEAQADVEVLEDDAEQTKEGAARSRVSLRVCRQCQH